jgi:hypothetical protein
MHDDTSVMHLSIAGPPHAQAGLRRIVFQRGNAFAPFPPRFNSRNIRMRMVHAPPSFRFGTAHR